MFIWRKVTFVFLMILVFTYGCASSDYMMLSEQGEQKIEKTKIFDKDFDSVYTAILKTTTLKGYSLVTHDKDSGIVSTDFLETKEAVLYMFGYRHKLNFLVEKISNSSTQVTITPVFQIKPNDNAQWQLARRRPHQVGIEKDVFLEIEKHI